MTRKHPYEMRTKDELFELATAIKFARVLHSLLESDLQPKLANGEGVVEFITNQLFNFMEKDEANDIQILGQFIVVSSRHIKEEMGII